jgi:hypothetical protein
VIEVVNAYSLFIDNYTLCKRVNILNSFVPDVLKFDLKDAGLLAALPYLVMGITVQFGGFLADWLRSQGNLTTTQVLGNSYLCLCCVTVVKGKG